MCPNEHLDQCSPYVWASTGYDAILGTNAPLDLALSAFLNVSLVPALVPYSIVCPSLSYDVSQLCSACHVMGPKKKKYTPNTDHLFEPRFEKVTSPAPPRNSSKQSIMCIIPMMGLDMV